MHILNIFFLSLMIFTEKSLADNLPSGCQAAFRSAALQAHNIFRARHGSPALTVNPSLEASALTYAKYLAVNDVFQHSRNRGNVGENLYVSYSEDPLTTDQCTRKKNFNFFY